MPAALNKRRLAPHGYVAVNKPMAKALYEQGITVTLCGNNVNNYHVFGGWHLGHTINRKEIDTQYAGFPDLAALYTWEHRCSDMLSYLDKELGTYLVYFVAAKDLPH